MKIVIPGGSGQVGALLANHLAAEGHDVTVLSRSGGESRQKVVQWDARAVGDWAAEIDGADVVINLAGRSVNCRYTPENRRAMMNSRVESTRAVGEAIAKAERPPKLWLQMSTATIYSHRFDAANDEASGEIGGSEPDAPASWRFSIEIAKNWEGAAAEADTPQTRKVLMRTAIVLSPDRGGIFDVLLGLVRRGLGGTAGSGRQYISWVHDRDLINAVKWLIEHDELSGPVNIASPEPLPNRDFMRILRESWGTRIGLPASEWMLAVGAVLMRSETELMLMSRRVIPTKLLDSGFKFEFPDWADASRDLCERWREQNGR